MALLFASNIWDFLSHVVGFDQRCDLFFLELENQWIIFLCLCTYSLWLLKLRHINTLPFFNPTNPPLWLACLLLINALVFVVKFAPSTEILIFASSVLLGQAAGCLRIWMSKAQFGADIVSVTVAILTGLLSIASVVKTDSDQSFQYHNQSRWSGLWDNPNIFGLLMGTGVVLALGFLIENLKVLSVIGYGNLKVRKYVIVCLYFAATCFMVRALLHSYSRGAWIATLSGLVFVMFHMGKVLKSIQTRFSQGRLVGCRKSNLFALVVALFAAAIILFWHLQRTERHPVSRALSIVNVLDFSWRNRIIAWEGDLQVMCEHPLLGAGWTHPEMLYEYYYLPPKLTEGAAIQMNDCLMLGATLGVPALFCLAMYFWLRLTEESRLIRQGFNTLNFELCSLDWSLMVCRGGAIVLLLGFWFDGGLFKLPTAPIFWILLELGASQPYLEVIKRTDEVS
jgi:hypothetical protein